MYFVLVLQGLQQSNETFTSVIKGIKTQINKKQS